jgi:hypothetical protein
MRVLSLTLLAFLLTAPAAGADAPEPRSWVEISVFCQCCPTPWGKSESDIRPYFQRYKIPVYRYQTEPRIVCAACSCPTNLKQLIQVRTEDVPRVQNLLAKWGQSQPRAPARNLAPAR